MVLVHFQLMIDSHHLSHDISPYGLRAFQSHQMPSNNERPIEFASRKLVPIETAGQRGISYSLWCEEVSPVCVQYRQKFELKTDHKPPIHILKESQTTPSTASGQSNCGVDLKCIK